MQISRKSKYIDILCQMLRQCKYYGVSTDNVNIYSAVILQGLVKINCRQIVNKTHCRPMTNNLMKQHTTGSLLNPGQRGLLFDYPSHEALLKPARRVHALEEKQDSQHKTHSRMICMCLVHLTGRKKNTVWPAGSVFPARKLSIICYHQLRLYESFAKYETGCCFIALSIY